MGLNLSAGGGHRQRIGADGKPDAPVRRVTLS